MAARDGRAVRGAARFDVAGRTFTRTLAGGTAKLRLPRSLRPGRHRVVATYPGGEGVAAAAATAFLTVSKARPRIAARVSAAPIAATRRGAIQIAAVLPGGGDAVHPVGQLLVRDGGRLIRVGVLRRSDRGRARLVLPRLRPGAHYLRVSLSGGASQRASTTAYRLLRVR